MSVFDEITKAVATAKTDGLWLKDSNGRAKAAATQLRRVWEEVRKQLGPSSADIPLSCLEQAAGNGRSTVSPYVFEKVSEAEVVYGIDLALTVGDISEHVTFEVYGVSGDPASQTRRWYLRVEDKQLHPDPYSNNESPGVINAEKVAPLIIASLRSKLIAKASS